MSKKGARRQGPGKPEERLRKGRAYVPAPGGPFKNRAKEANKHAARKRNWKEDDYDQEDD